MITRCSPRRTCQGLAFAAIIGVLSACGGSDGSTPAADQASEATQSQGANDASDAGADGDAGAENETPAAPAPDSPPLEGQVDSGSATLSLDNGESFEFAVLCVLEPQISAGSEILFTASSFDEPRLDVTQFGDEGTVTDLATITVSNASFEVLWEANSVFEPVGGSIELSLNGSTINGSGLFFPAGDIALTPVNGTLVANC